MDTLNIKKAIRPYFNYYLDLYPPEITDNYIIFTIPMLDGCRSLDNYFINPLLDNGFI